MLEEKNPLHVSIIAVPESMISTVTGFYDILNSMALLARAVPALPQTPAFIAEIVSETGNKVHMQSGLTLPSRPVSEVQRTDIIVAPSMMPAELDWIPGRHDELVRWIARMHDQGALLASACTGLLLLGETGLFDGREATMHPQLVRTCQKRFPQIRLKPEHVLVTDGASEQYVSSGGATTWHDLALYLIARFAGNTTAVEMARFFALRAHDHGQAFYTVFAPPFDHGDAMVRDAQHWLTRHVSCERPVDAMVSRSGAAPRTFKRRFRCATGHTPMDYVQRLRVEKAKRKLERTESSVDEIGASVGYVDPAFFRRLFKRLTQVTPAVYRQQMRVPEPARKLT